MEEHFTTPTLVRIHNSYVNVFPHTWRTLVDMTKVLLTYVLNRRNFATTIFAIERAIEQFKNRNKVVQVTN